MQSLASVVGTIAFEAQPEESAPQKTVEILAGAHGVSVAEMVALWRGSGLAPPTEEARVLKYRASKLLIPELLKRSEKRRENVAKAAVNAAWSITNLEALAAKDPRPTLQQLLEKITSPRLKVLAEKFHPDKTGGALIMGPTGVGKSVACLCIMLRCMRDEALADFDASLKIPFDEPAPRGNAKSWFSIDAMDLGIAQQRTGLGDPEPQCITQAKDAGNLILDDLGWERGFHVEALIQVAAPRYRRGLATLVTSGETHEALRERYTDAVLRRFWNVDGRKGAVVDLWKNQVQAA